MSAIGWRIGPSFPSAVLAFAASLPARGGPCLRSVVFLVSIAAAMFAAQPARADTLDTLLGIAATALGEPWLKDARPLIECVKNKGPASCTKTTVKVQGQQAAKEVLPNDPLIAKAVNLIKALEQKDWIGVLELAGTGALQIACKAGLVSAGPLKEFLCNKAATLAEPVVKTVLIVVKNPSPGNLVKAIAALGNPDLACSLVDFPGKDAICGPLGDIVNGVATGVTAAVGALGNLLEDIAGQTQHMPVESYYLAFWRPWLHYAVVHQLQTGQAHYMFAGMYANTSTTCAEYFDSHKMSKSNADKVCGIMKSRFKQEVDQTVNLFQAYPDAFFSSSVAPNVAAWAIQYYGKVDGFISTFGKTKSWNGTALYTFLLNKKPPFKDLWGQCLMQAPLSLPPITQSAIGSPGYIKSLGTATSWACVVAVGHKLAAALALQKLKLHATLIPQLGKAGCPNKASPDGTKLYFYCDNYDGHKQCRDAITAVGVGQIHTHCGVDQPVANKKLAGKIAATLGAKRCQPSATGYTQTIACTRPWKEEQCKTLLAEATQGLAGVYVACQFKEKLGNEPAFSTMKKQAQEILNVLNGVKKAGASAGSGGSSTQLAKLPPVSSCSHTWDPLTIVCKNPKALAALKGGPRDISLEHCRPDANQDGADKPCYGGPLSKAASEQAAAKAGVGVAGVQPKPAGATKPGSGFVPGPAVAGNPPFPGAGAASASPIRAGKPRLAVSDVRVRIERNCQAAQPALTAEVAIRNTGGALRAGKGTIQVMETGGANLSSAGILLPAIGAGRTQIVAVPAATLSSYAALAGGHQLVVHLNPSLEGNAPSFDKPAAPYALTVNFPAGHCGSRTLPAPMRSQQGPAAPARP